MWKFGAKLPIVQGASFAAVTPMIVIGGEYGIQGSYGSVIVAGILTVLATPFFGKLLRFSPPVVTGAIIAIIGVSLMPVAVRWSAGGVPGAPEFGSPANIGLAFFTLIVVPLITRFAGGILGGFLSRVSTLFVRERRAVGLTGLSQEEDEAFQQMNPAYEEKFGFPLVTAIRDHTKETLLEDAEPRLKHNREQETLISVVEVVKIANYRLQDVVGESFIVVRS